MKRVFSALAVLLLCAPVLATNVAITCTEEPNGVVRIDYTVTGQPKVRAFALDIKADTATIDAVTNFVVGESVAPTNLGYGIFPANFSRYITVDPNTGQVKTWDVNDYTPVADVNDPGAAGALGSNAITIEMGALYYPADDSSPNAPPAIGTLCKIKVSSSCTVSISENPTRGGVVLTDPAVDPNVTLTGCPVTVGAVAQALALSGSGSEYADWVALGRPQCWLSPYQCDGDADGQTSGPPDNFRVFTGDLSLIVDNWKKTADDPTLNPCADIDHKDSGYPYRYRVFTSDLNILVANWKKTDAQLPGNCPRK